MHHAYCRSWRQASSHGAPTHPRPSRGARFLGRCTSRKSSMSNASSLSLVSAGSCSALGRLRISAVSSSENSGPISMCSRDGRLAGHTCWHLMQPSNVPRCMEVIQAGQGTALGFPSQYVMHRSAVTARNPEGSDASAPPGQQRIHASQPSQNGRRAGSCQESQLHGRSESSATILRKLPIPGAYARLFLPYVDRPLLAANSFSGRRA